MHKSLESDEEIDMGSDYIETWDQKWLLLMSLIKERDAICISDLCGDPKLAKEISRELRSLNED
jgi:hypothetical protein